MIADDDLFRDTYILTMTQSKFNAEASDEDEDFFDVTQMADVAFESFAEVCLLNNFFLPEPTR